MKLSDIKKGDSVEILSVNFPNLPHHAMWIGKIGVVLKTRKYDKSALVFVDDPGFGERYCFADNIKSFEK